MTEIIKDGFETNVSADDFYNAVMNSRPDVTEVEWNGLTFNVRYNITLNEALNFIDYVADCNFSGKNGEYTPEIHSFALSRATIVFFTNIELPDDIDKQYDLLACNNNYSTESNIIMCIRSHISSQQMNIIECAIHEKIRYMLNTRVKEVSSKIEKAVDGIVQTVDMISETFGGIDSETIEKLVSSLGDHMFDEEKLVKAFVTAKSDENTDDKSDIIDGESEVIEE